MCKYIIYKCTIYNKIQEFYVLCSVKFSTLWHNLRKLVARAMAINSINELRTYEIIVIHIRYIHLKKIYSKKSIWEHD